MNNQDPKALAQLAMKISSITNAIGVVRQDGKNTNSHYGFISYEQLNAILREQLPKNQVALFPSFHTLEERDTEIKGKVVTRTIAYGEVTIVDCETGAQLIMKMAGADQDYGGKSSGQAETEAYKRFLMKLFLVSSKDDADADYRTTTIGIDNGPISAEQISQLSTLLKKTNSDVARFMKYMQVSSLEEITQDNFKIALTALQQKGASQ